MDIVVYLKNDVKFEKVYLLQYKTTKLVVYWDYTSKCTNNATTNI